MKAHIYFISLVLVLLSYNVSGQKVYQEVGLRLTGLTSFDFVYKKQMNENTFKRYRLGVGNLSLQFYDDILFNVNFGFAVGKELRIDIADRLQFVHGWEPSFYLSFSRNDTDLNVQGGLNLGHVLGFQYNVSDRFSVSLESIPYVGLYGGYDGSEIIPIGLRAGFNSQDVAITLVYRFLRRT